LDEPTSSGTSRRSKQLFDAFRAGDTDASDELTVEGYVQHNPQAPNGLAAVKAFFAPPGPVDVEAHRRVAENDLVVAHSHHTTRAMADVDIFRLDPAGHTIDHFDVLQPVPETTASGNDMFQPAHLTAPTTGPAAGHRPTPGRPIKERSRIVASETEQRNMELMQTLDDAWNVLLPRRLTHPYAGEPGATNAHRLPATPTTKDTAP
jgi:predicted SnoaL-like aldol condensation-catalyzing enzyme